MSGRSNVGFTVAVECDYDSEWAERWCVRVFVLCCVRRCSDLLRLAHVVVCVIFSVCAVCVICRVECAAQRAQCADVVLLCTACV